MRNTIIEDGKTVHRIAVYDETTGGLVRFEEFNGPLAWAQQRARSMLKELGSGYEASVESCYQSWIKQVEDAQEA